LLSRLRAAFGAVSAALIGPDDTEEQRIRKQVFLVTQIGVAAAGAAWGLMYLLLRRPLSAAVPGVYALICIGVMARFIASRRLGRLPELNVLLMAVLPAALQATLGGYHNSSAVVVWAFLAPLSALTLCSARVTRLAMAAFIADVAGLGIIDQRLASAVAPLSPLVRTALYIFNLAGVATITFLFLDQFHRQREAAQARSDALLLNILPGPIAARLKRRERPIADAYPEVTILFCDIVGFTPVAARTPPAALVRFLDELFARFDTIALQLGLEKIKTLGDAYMVASGVPVARADHADAAAEMALEMISAIAAARLPDGRPVEARIGLHTGPVVAGVIGSHKFAYDLWGDAVNVASRMQAHSQPGRIQLTEDTRRRLSPRFRLEMRGGVEVKGRGQLVTYWLLGRSEEAAAG
jgi:guanylate cyclase